MDIMEIKTTFMRKIASDALSRMVLKNTGCKVKLDIHKFSVSFEDGLAHLHLDVEGFTKEDEIKKLVGKLGL